jgi:hypothetical protein
MPELDGFETLRLYDLMPFKLKVHADKVDHARLVVHHKDELAVAVVGAGEFGCGHFSSQQSAISK